MAPKNTPKTNLPRSQDRELLMVLATKSHSVHIHIGDSKGAGQASLKSRKPKYIRKVSVRMPKVSTLSRKLSSSFGAGERQI